MIEYGDFVSTVDMFQVFSLIIVITNELKTIETGNEHLYNLLVKFQLHLKRVFNKYLDEQVLYISFSIQKYLYKCNC